MLKRKNEIIECIVGYSREEHVHMTVQDDTPVNHILD